jgi:2-polyprenyl-3-methyl-5-hydroxy-6-metoxy-1,4-benzoquinol methylase
MARDYRPLVNVVCTRCGLMRQDPMPTEAQLSQYYRHDYRRDLKGSAEPRKRDLARHRLQAKQRLAFLGPLLQPGTRVLDVGSGSGVFLQAASEHGCSAQGIEPDVRYATRVRQELDLPVHNGSWETAQFEAGSFDVVVAHHVFEHLPRPTAALRRLHEWIVDGGHVYVSVPDIGNPDASPLNRFQRAHMHGFTHETLVMIGLKTGFEAASVPGAQATTLVFKRLPRPRDDWFCFPDHGATMVEFFRRNSLPRYLMRKTAYRRYAHHLAQRAMQRWREIFE